MIRGNVAVQKSLNQYKLELFVVRFFLEMKSKYLPHKWQKYFTLFILAAQLLRCKTILLFFDPLELFLLSQRGIIVNEYQFTIDDIKKQIAQLNQVVSTAQSHHIQCIFA